MADEKSIAAVIAANIIYYMDVNHLSRRELADRIGVSLASIGFWCTGTKIPRMDKVDKMCEIFGCTRSNLLNDYGDRSASSSQAYSDLSPHAYEVGRAYDEADDAIRQAVDKLLDVRGKNTHDSSGSLGAGEEAV